MRRQQRVPKRRGRIAAAIAALWIGMPLAQAAIAYSKANDGSFLTRYAADVSVTGSGVTVDMYIDTTSAGSDSYDGTAPFFTSGTTGPKKTMPVNLTSTAKKYAVLTGSTIPTDYGDGTSINQGILINQSGGITYIVGWSRAFNQEVVPTTPGFKQIVDLVYNTGAGWDSTYLANYFFKMQGSNVINTASTQGCAFNCSSPTVIRNALVDGHTYVANAGGTGTFVTEDCSFQNGGTPAHGAPITIVGTISSGVLTVSSASGPIWKNGFVSGAGIAATTNWQVTGYSSGGTPGGTTGSYTTNAPDASGTFTVFYGGIGWWGRHTINSIQGPIIRRCWAQPGSIGEDFLFTQVTGSPAGAGPYGITVVDCVIIHDAIRGNDEAQHKDVFQISSDPGNVVIKRNIIEHRLPTVLTNRQGTNIAHPIGTFFVEPDGATATSHLTATIDIRGNIIISNTSLFNLSNINWATMTIAMNDNLMCLKPNSVAVDPLSGANSYYYGINESNTVAHTGTGNTLVVMSPNYPPSSANNSTHDSFLTGTAAANITNGFTFVQA